jgi:plant cysteine oxidase
MGIFVFPPHARIPLHDHPGMCVISRVLYGEVQRRSLDLPSNVIVKTATTPETRRRAYFRTLRQTNPSSYNRNDSSTSSCADPASDAASSSVLLKIPVETIVAPYCTVLYPHVGNLHEFIAGPNGAAVLDVLLPPYDADHHRDCTFYDIVEDDDEDGVAAHVATTTTTRNGGIDKPGASTSLPISADDCYISHSCWIIPINRPEDFHCLSGQYRTLGG